MFPIRASTGYVIGFSGHKFNDKTTGGKYVNTSEKPLSTDILPKEAFKIDSCRAFYNLFLETKLQQQPLDFLQLISQMKEGEGKRLLEELTEKN